MPRHRATVRQARVERGAARRFGPQRVVGGEAELRRARQLMHNADHRGVRVHFLHRLAEEEALRLHTDRRARRRLQDRRLPAQDPLALEELLPREPPAVQVVLRALLDQALQDVQ